jgi:cell division protein ZapA
MSEVALQIGGRTYRVACAAGEEERVTRLGATISEKVASIGNPTGPDAQNLLFAALLLADEVQESRESGSASNAGHTADREADITRGEIDPLKARIADLEAELERTREAADASLGEIETARAKEIELSRAIAGHENETARLQARLDVIEQAAAARSASPSGGGGIPDLIALAPALERFAEMLEECADKLESRAAAS